MGRRREPMGRADGEGTSLCRPHQVGEFVRRSTRQPRRVARPVSRVPSATHSSIVLHQTRLSPSLHHVGSSVFAVFFLPLRRAPRSRFRGSWVSPPLDPRLSFWPSASPRLSFFPHCCLSSSRSSRRPARTPARVDRPPLVDSPLRCCDPALSWHGCPKSCRSSAAIDGLSGLAGRSALFIGCRVASFRASNRLARRHARFVPQPCSSPCSSGPFFFRGGRFFAFPRCSL